MSIPLKNGLPQIAHTNSSPQNVQKSVRTQPHLQNDDERLSMRRVQQTEHYEFYIRLLAKIATRLGSIHHTPPVCMLWNASTAPKSKFEHPKDLLSVFRNMHNGTYVKNAYCLRGESIIYLDEPAILAAIYHAIRNTHMLSSLDLSFHRTAQNLLDLINDACKTRLHKRWRVCRPKCFNLQPETMPERPLMNNTAIAKLPHANENRKRRYVTNGSSAISKDRYKVSRVERDLLSCSLPTKKVNATSMKKKKKSRQVSLMFLSTRGLVQRRGKKTCCKFVMQRHRILKEKLNAMINISGKITHKSCVTDREREMLLQNLDMLERNHDDLGIVSSSDETLAVGIQAFVARPSHETETAVIHELEAQIAAVEYEIIHSLFVKPDQRGSQKNVSPA